MFHVQWPVKLNDENGISKLLDKNVLKEAFLNISSTIMTEKGEDSKVAGRYELIAFCKSTFEIQYPFFFWDTVSIAKFRFWSSSIPSIWSWTKPTLICFLFLNTSMDQYYKSLSVDLTKMLSNKTSVISEQGLVIFLT